MNQEAYFFTFGTNSQFGHHYVLINGDADTTRTRMFAEYGRKWSMQYPVEDLQRQAAEYNYSRIYLPSQILELFYDLAKQAANGGDTVSSILDDLVHVSNLPTTG
ncbi:MAG: hypothetical protein RQ731_08025 [Anaerosomatales bacterium]|nr:hypothetical protein [Anaerosomatales bacterium]